MMKKVFARSWTRNRGGRKKSGSGGRPGPICSSPAPTIVITYWSVLAGGRHQLPFVTMSAIMGGNVRVGLEDSLYAGKGKLATSNAEQVSIIRSVVENLSLEIATPAEAREMLQLKGGDQVGF